MSVAGKTKSHTCDCGAEVQISLYAGTPKQSKICTLAGDKCKGSGEAKIEVEKSVKKKKSQPPIPQVSQEEVIQSIFDDRIKGILDILPTNIIKRDIVMGLAQAADIQVDYEEVYDAINKLMAEILLRSFMYVAFSDGKTLDSDNITDFIHPKLHTGRCARCSSFPDWAIRWVSKYTKHVIHKYQTDPDSSHRPDGGCEYCGNLTKEALEVAEEYDNNVNTTASRVDKFGA